MDSRSSNKNKISRRDFLKLLTTSAASAILSACGKKTITGNSITESDTTVPKLDETATPTQIATATPTRVPTKTPNPTNTLPPMQDSFFITPHVNPLSAGVLLDMISRLGRGKDIKLGFAHDVWYLKNSETPVLQSLQNIFDVAIETNLPVFLQINGGPYGGVPNPWMNDIEIVEWDINLKKISEPFPWLGRQFVALNHPLVINEKVKWLKNVVNRVASFYRKFPYLLAGLGTDSEQHIDDDAGYHAAELTKLNGPTDPLFQYLSNMDDFREHLIHNHVELLAKTMHEQMKEVGIPNPEKLVYTHQVGENTLWDERNDPGWTAFNQFSRPGFTLYGQNAIDIPKVIVGLLEANNNSPWASEEWHPWLNIEGLYPEPLSADIWEYSLKNMINHNCRDIVVFGWNINDFPGGITNYNYDDSTAIEGIRRVLDNYSIDK